MRLNKLAKKIFAAGLAVSLMMANAGVGFAADPNPKYTTQVTFNHELTVPAGATTPTVTYSYTVTAATGDELNTKPEGTIAVSSGIEADKITVTTAAFSSSDAPVDGKVTKPVTLNLSAVEFTEPGIYRYKVVEAADKEWNGLSKDETARFLDVYVFWKEDGTLGLSSLLHKADKPEEKDDTFETAYTTQKLTLSKTVTGNQGSHTQEFTFKVVVSGAPDGAVFTIKKGDVSETITATNGVATKEDIKLAHGKTIDVTGLPKGVTCTITETAADGYTTTYVIDGGEKTQGLTAEKEIADADATVAFTNDKDGTIPTGVILDSAPFILIIGLAAAALIFTAARKKVR